jgi:hypothetical protein
MARPKEKNHPPERRNPATAATVHGAFGNPELGGSGRKEAYPTRAPRATLTLRSIHDEQGRFQGLEAVAYG